MRFVTGSCIARKRLGAKIKLYPIRRARAVWCMRITDPALGLRVELAVAGGPIDKSWLLLLAWLKQDGIDLKSDATIAYGAPPLLAAKTLSGEMDATLNYWNFCAGLEAKGFRRIAGIEDLLPKLGAKGRTAMIGYVFDEKWANANQDKIARFSPNPRGEGDPSTSMGVEKNWPLTVAPSRTLLAYAIAS